MRTLSAPVRLAGFLLTGLLIAACGPALGAEKDLAALMDEAMLAESTDLRTWLAVLPIVIPLLGAAVTMTLRHLIAWQSLMALATMAGTTAAAIALNAEVLANGPLVMAVGNWLPPFGIVIAIDALGSLFVLLTAIVGLIGLAFARADVEGEGVRWGFYTFYCLLICGVCGAFSTGDVFNLYVWFEVFLISSFGLIIHGGTRVQMDGAVKYGVLNLIATTIFLLSVGALYGLTGTLNMADIQFVIAEGVRLSADPAAQEAAAAGAQAATPEAAGSGGDGAQVSQGLQGPIATIGALFVLAFAMKAAAFPLHFWLPASYPTPKIIVAALFAGLLTKVGVYSLLRVMIMLYGDAGEIYYGLIAVVGIATAVIGALGALAQKDLKRLAAFLVVSGIGLMLIGFGLGTEAGLSGAIVYAAHSILVMTALFLVVGAAERLAGHSDLSRGANLYATHGFFATLYLMTAFAVAGLPPFSGFWAKFLLLDASLQQEGVLAGVSAAAIIVSGILTTIVLGRVWALTFLRPASVDGAPAGEGAPPPPLPTTVILPIALLTAIVLGLGLFPGFLLEPAAEGAAGLLDPSLYLQRVLEID